MYGRKEGRSERGEVKEMSRERDREEVGELRKEIIALKEGNEEEKQDFERRMKDKICIVLLNLQGKK